MSYIVTKTDGTTLTTIIDGTKDDTSSSLTLIGRNYSNYGEFVANDFIKLLENFSADNAPPYPLEGQIWWKKNDNLLQVYNGSEWRSITHVTATSFAYTTTLAGDVWWDTTDQQLHVYNGTSPYNVSGWVLVGPSYSSRFGKSGALWESIQDSSNVTHHVLIMYLDNLVTGIISTDAEFTPDIAIPGFTTIKRGYNVRSADVFNGTATNATLFDNLATTKFFRNDIDNVTTGNLVVQNNTGLTIGATRQLKINMNGIDASITNSASNGDFNVYVNVDGTSTKALYIEGSTGAIEVAGDPITSPGIATKNYVDKQFVNTTLYGMPMAPTMPTGTANTSIATTAFTAAANVVMRGYVDSIHPLKANIANPVFVGVPMAPTMPAGTANTSIATTNFVSSANIAMQGYVDSIDTLKANIASPTFTGIPRSVTPATGDNSSNIATSAFVYAANLAMTGYVSSLASSTTSGLALKANIAGPVFTGVPYCATTPAAGDNDKKIATTEYVDRANTTQAAAIDSLLSAKAPISSPAFQGTPTTASTPAALDNTTKLATTQYVDRAIGNYNPPSQTAGFAPLANPAFSGTPTAPTPGALDNTTKLATTQYVDRAIGNYTPPPTNFNGYATLASPAFSGIPTAPTPSWNINSTQIATTEYVQTANTAMKGYVDNKVGSTAVLTAGSYANPSWITSLAYSKITGAPAVGGGGGGDLLSTSSYANPSWITSLAYSKITGAPSQYTLTAATTLTLGGVKVDNSTITINSSGVISATGGGSGGYTLPQAGTGSGGTLGGVRVDNSTITINGSGVISVASALTGFAPLANPAFTGTPTTASNPADTDNSTKLATTAFVKTAISNASIGGGTPVAPHMLQSTADPTTSLLLDSAAGSGLAMWKFDDDIVLVGTRTGLFLKGFPTAPTMPQSLTGNLSIATTQYVHAATEKWAGSAKTISTAAPSGGVNGDIWFRYS